MPDKWVRADCFDDYAIKAFTEGNAEKTYCSYCRKTSDSPIPVHFYDLFDFILEGIESEWEDPANSMAMKAGKGAIKARKYMIGTI